MNRRQNKARAGVAHRNPFLWVMASLTVFAWTALWVWASSPYGRYLNHDIWSSNGLAAGICSAIPNGAVVIPATLFIGGWLLMTTAMMLPTTLPLLDLFRRLISRRSDRTLLLFLVILGYLMTWTAFGVAAHAASWLVLDAVKDNVWVSLNSWIFGAVILLVAGAFQFTTLKYRCLDRCRSPMSFVMKHWRGKRERWHSFLLGVDHGVFCVGCCWALMLLMFVVGTGSIGWMLVLGAAMAIEKNMPWGRRISVPLGAVLIGWGSSIALLNFQSGLL